MCVRADPGGVCCGDGVFQAAVSGVRGKWRAMRCAELWAHIMLTLRPPMASLLCVNSLVCFIENVEN